ncbi:uncharacterized protein LOC127241204, partial [Andrographis paniculata]|uniref:uncharacterized protein LOC127241204 n=1 Tax=Andrographis paniculata TaxID=175694 RepID=UPI0021E8B58D
LGIIGGLVGAAGCIAIHTAKQQLFHSPSVQVTKQKRECIPEVDNPDAVIKSASKFENKSFLRKIAHIQGKESIPHSRRPQNRETETLKSIGINK